MVRYQRMHSRYLMTKVRMSSNIGQSYDCLLKYSKGVIKKLSYEYIKMSLPV